MNIFITILDSIKNIVWGLPSLCLLIITGIYLTFLLPVRNFVGGKAFFQNKNKETTTGDISCFQSAMTVAASAVGTGSIIGVATALSYGGFGSIFWLWIASFFSVAIKYAESFLALTYRTQGTDGQISGGPMYYIDKGIGSKKLAITFASIGAFAAFGTGNVVQANSIAAVMDIICGISPLVTGIVLAGFTALVLIKGIKSVGRIAAICVPFMAVTYIVVGLVIIIMHFDKIGAVFHTILSGAFSGQAAVGGFLGATFMSAVQFGVSRSFLCSEAGFGVPSIAAAAAKTNNPVQHAFISSVITLFATTVICTMTACIIGVTDVFGSVDESGNLANGAYLVLKAFDATFTSGRYIALIALVLFAYSTVIAWAYYGEKCVAYVLEHRWVKAYKVLFALGLIPGALCGIDVVWPFADIMNALLIFPNVFALIRLSKNIRLGTKHYFSAQTGISCN